MRRIHTLTTQSEAEKQEFETNLARLRQLNTQGLPQPNTVTTPNQVTHEGSSELQPSVPFNPDHLPATGSYESPNANYPINQIMSANNIDLSPFQDTIPSRWYLGEETHGEAEEPQTELLSSVELENKDNFSDEDSYDVEKNELTQEEKVSEHEELEQAMNLQAIVSEDHLAKAKLHFDKAKSISELNAVEVNNAITQINKDIIKTVEETKALVQAAERSWILNLGENIQHLTSIANGLGNACVTFMSSTVKIVIFMGSNWAGVLLLVIIICGGVAVTPYLLSKLARLLSRSIAFGWGSVMGGNDTGPVLRVPTWVPRIGQTTNGATYAGIIAATGGITAFIMRIFRK